MIELYHKIEILCSKKGVWAIYNMKESKNGYKCYLDLNKLGFYPSKECKTKEDALYQSCQDALEIFKIFFIDDGIDELLCEDNQSGEGEYEFPLAYSPKTLGSEFGKPLLNMLSPNLKKMYLGLNQYNFVENHLYISFINAVCAFLKITNPLKFISTSFGYAYSQFGFLKFYVKHSKNHKSEIAKVIIDYMFQKKALPENLNPNIPNASKQLLKLNSLMPQNSNLENSYINSSKNKLDCLVNANQSKNTNELDFYDSRCDRYYKNSHHRERSSSCVRSPEYNSADDSYKNKKYIRKSYHDSYIKPVNRNYSRKNYDYCSSSCDSYKKRSHSKEPNRYYNNNKSYHEEKVSSYDYKSDTNSVPAGSCSKYNEYNSRFSKNKDNE